VAAAGGINSLPREREEVTVMLWVISQIDGFSLYFSLRSTGLRR